MRSIAGALLGSLIWLLIAPGLIAGYVPWAITRWRVQPAFLDSEITRFIGALLIVLGLPLLLEAFARFALQGRGTPAPVLPPERLVVFGFYRNVRNPMYVAVTALIVGQALLLGDARLLLLAAGVWLSFHLFVMLYEEPHLRRRFPADYAAYCAAVPRWIPRSKPWQGEKPTSS
jgi:protein-S-isoprenylcysteine O-methyltransferase Ste14